ncbi:MAG: Crp/Fnr family transcriptional regulator, partial [Rubrobacter sp.]
PLTHYDLAEMIATTRESVTAAMRSLRKQGLLKKVRQTITILDLEGLVEVASPRLARRVPTG